MEEKKDNLLTLGIPTYNRSSAIFKNVKELINSKAFQKIGITIIDDASNDDTFQRLYDLCKGFPIKLMRNSANLGYPGNFLKLFSECQTEYMIVTSDDDPLIYEQIDRLKQFLDKYRPIFVSTNYYLQGELYRGKREIQRISYEDLFSACTHAPGLVYRLDESKKAINAIKNHIEKTIYPQVFLVSELYMMSNNKTVSCFWWNEPIVRRGQNLPSGLGKYYYLSARWEQQKFFIDFYTERIKESSNHNYRSKAKRLLEIQEKKIFHKIRNAIKKERGTNFLSAFDREAKAFYKRSIVDRLKRLFLRFLHNPRSTTRKLVKKYIHHNYP